MEISELRHRVILRNIVNIVDEHGFNKEVPVDYKKVWASITNLYGKEYFEAAAVQMENTVKFTIRYMDNIDTSMRILFKGRHYNITSIDNIKFKNRFLEIKAVEVDLSG